MYYFSLSHLNHQAWINHMLAEPMLRKELGTRRWTSDYWRDDLLISYNTSANIKFSRATYVNHYFTGHKGSFHAVWPRNWLHISCVNKWQHLFYNVVNKNCVTFLPTFFPRQSVGNKILVNQLKSCTVTICGWWYFQRTSFLVTPKYI